jgi:predicted transcriptional regulator
VELDAEDEKEEADSAPNAAEVKQALKTQIAELKAIYRAGDGTAEVQSLTTALDDVEAAERNLKQAIKVLTKQLAELDRQIVTRRGSITIEEAKALILLRLCDDITEEMQGYFVSQLRKIFTVFENIYEKYSCPLSQIQAIRLERQNKLEKYIRELGYE